MGNEKTLTDIACIRVHPGIGIARLGNSDCYFIGPESPGFVPDPGGHNGPGPEGGSYKDDQQCIKRQAQRFRIYAYNANNEVIQEINADTALVSDISWRVHVRNMKAANYAFQGAYLFDPNELRNPSIQPHADPIDRDQLIIDPGPRTISHSSPQPVKLTGGIFNNVGPYGDGTGLTLSRYLQFDCPQNPPDGQDVEVTYTGVNDIELGQLELDQRQCLVFIPGPGKSESVTTPKVVITNPSEHHNPPNGPDLCNPLINQFSYFNVPGWYDDTCGGEIDATVTLSDGRVFSTRDNVSAGSDGDRNARRGAWVVVGPPKYSPYMYHVVSILDRVFEVFPDADPNAGKPTNFYRDVYPILERATNCAWVSAEAYGQQGTAHGPRQPGNLLSKPNLEKFTDSGAGGTAARRQIYNIMRHAEDNLPPTPPEPAKSPRPAGAGPRSRGNKMPKLWGTGGKPLQNQQLDHNLPNQYLSLTPWQLSRMKDWGEGNFAVGTWVKAQPLDALPVAEQPIAMDCAALEPTIGGGFHPGIEFPYLILYPEFFAEAFRVAANVEPGSVAAYMSSPWQGDFWSCNTAWWPVQRPDIVVEFDAQKNTSTKEWFRGYDPQDGQPLSSTDGYDQMVRVWWQLGMVLPVPQDDGSFEKDDNEVIYKECERDPALNEDKPND
jgi:hypothetical protein